MEFNVDEYEDEHPHKDDANHHHGSTLSSCDYIEHGAYLIHRSIVESLSKQPSGQAIGLKEKIGTKTVRKHAKVTANKHHAQRKLPSEQVVGRTRCAQSFYGNHPLRKKKKTWHSRRNKSSGMRTSETCAMQRQSTVHE